MIIDKKERQKLVNQAVDRAKKNGHLFLEGELRHRTRFALYDYCGKCRAFAKADFEQEQVSGPAVKEACSGGRQ